MTLVEGVRMTDQQLQKVFGANKIVRVRGGQHAVVIILGMNQSIHQPWPLPPAWIHPHAEPTHQSTPINQSIQLIHESPSQPSDTLTHIPT